MRITYDAEADILGIWLEAEKESEGAKELAPGVFLDLASDGTPVAMEVWDASKRYPAPLLERVSFDRLVPLKEAAQQYGLSPSRLRRLAEKGELHAKKRGRNWLTTPGFIEDYLTTQQGS